jgi:hypothetical protein
MRFTEFTPGPSENILFESAARTQVLRIAWRIFTGLLVILILVFVINTVLSGWLTQLLSTFLPEAISSLLADLILLGIVPAILLLWQVDDAASSILGRFILTNQRIWIRSSPHTWSFSEIPLDDIATMRCQRDAIFLRQKSIRKLQVHMFPEAKKFTAAYESFIKSAK